MSLIRRSVLAAVVATAAATALVPSAPANAASNQVCHYDTASSRIDICEIAGALGATGAFPGFPTDVSGSVPTTRYTGTSNGYQNGMWAYAAYSKFNVNGVAQSRASGALRGYVSYNDSSSGRAYGGGVGTNRTYVKSAGTYTMTVDASAIGTSASSARLSFYGAYQIPQNSTSGKNLVVKWAPTVPLNRTSWSVSGTAAWTESTFSGGKRTDRTGSGKVTLKRTDATHFVLTWSPPWNTSRVVTQKVAFGLGTGAMNVTSSATG